MLNALWRFKTGLFLLVWLIVTNVQAKLSDLDYLSKSSDYIDGLPLPSEVLGYPVGTWHARHDQIVEYMRALASVSDRVQFKTIGYSHEQRPLIVLAISSPENIAKLDRIQQKRLNNVQNGAQPDPQDPLIIYMGYGVHGNEASGTNASLLVAYHLAAANDEQTLDLLENSVILVEPALNPDGLARFSQWVNMHRGKNLVPDPTHREHREYWPSGRTNHYWFDLNRDWLLLTHPESKARIEQYQAWRPHIVADFHEMGSNSTYFFQPGVPSRKNPYTPLENVKITGDIAKQHAKALDEAKQLYFTEESFDDFYYGKGSTYPDAQGSIGILFEQASSRGHVIETVNGDLSFVQTIKNQITTSFSTMYGALANKSAIIDYQTVFHNMTQKAIKDDDIAGFIIKKGRDTSSFERMIDILQAHNIKVSSLNKNLTINKVKYRANRDIFVSLDQAQYRLIKSLFSTQQRFNDNTFYDVSNWNIAFAFNLHFEAINRSSVKKLSLESYADTAYTTQNIQPNSYAYAFEWSDNQAPRLAYELLAEGVKLRVAGSDFVAKTSQGEHTFSKGSVVIPAALEQPEQLDSILETVFASNYVKLHNIQSGLTSKGIDLGSRQFSPLVLPKVLLIGGESMSSYEVGEIWHYLDVQLDMPVTIWDARFISTRDIDDYTHIIFASGSYTSINENIPAKLDQWVRKGGTLIGQKSALRWFAANGWIKNKLLSSSSIYSAFSKKGLSFEDKSAHNAQKLVAGAVYQAKIDLSHPLFFGYERTYLPVFKTSNMTLLSADDPFRDIAIYTSQPLLGGYSADQMQVLIKNTPAVVTTNIGKGHVVGFVDNVHFRGYYDGTSKLTANAIFMSSLF